MIGGSDRGWIPACAGTTVWVCAGYFQRNDGCAKVSTGGNPGPQLNKGASLQIPASSPSPQPSPVKGEGVTHSDQTSAGMVPAGREALGRKSGTSYGALPFLMDSTARMAGAAVSTAL